MPNSINGLCLILYMGYFNKGDQSRFCFLPQSFFSLCLFQISIQSIIMSHMSQFYCHTGHTRVGLKLTAWEFGALTSRAPMLGLEC